MRILLPTQECTKYLGAGIKSGDEILLICEGEEEEKALKAMIEAIESGLGE